MVSDRVKIAIEFHPLASVSFDAGHESPDVLAAFSPERFYPVRSSALPNLLIQPPIDAMLVPPQVREITQMLGKLLEELTPQCPNRTRHTAKEHRG